MTLVADKRDPAEEAETSERRFFGAGIVLSLLVHATVAIILIYGVRIPTYETEVAPIEVELVPLAELAPPPELVIPEPEEPEASEQAPPPEPPPPPEQAE
ncbi:MAG: hypothetical protein JJ979_24380, partial [Roseibium sp.]|nr:hypothetical protein [Roseibium sp.]